MEKKTGYMAEGLNKTNQFQDESARYLPGLVNLLMLGIVGRFQFNRNRYRTAQQADVQLEIGSLCRKAVYKMHVYRLESFHNGNEIIRNQSLFVLSNQISDTLYQIHHLLLELSIDQISLFFPEMDEVSSRWAAIEKDPEKTVSSGQIHADRQFLDRISESMTA